MKKKLTRIEQAEMERTVMIDRATIKGDTILAIVKLLEDARAKYGPEDWDNDGIEDQIIERVQETSNN